MSTVNSKSGLDPRRPVGSKPLHVHASSHTSMERPIRLQSSVELTCAACVTDLQTSKLRTDKLDHANDSEWSIYPVQLLSRAINCTQAGALVSTSWTIAATGRLWLSCTARNLYVTQVLQAKCIMLTTSGAHTTSVVHKQAFLCKRVQDGHLQLLIMNPQPLFCSVKILSVL